MITFDAYISQLVKPKAHKSKFYITKCTNIKGPNKADRVFLNTDIVDMDIDNQTFTVDTDPLEKGLYHIVYESDRGDFNKKWNQVIRLEVIFKKTLEGKIKEQENFLK